jgi:hypothetical protein
MRLEILLEVELLAKRQGSSRRWTAELLAPLAPHWLHLSPHTTSTT